MDDDDGRRQVRAARSRGALNPLPTTMIVADACIAIRALQSQGSRTGGSTEHAPAASMHPGTLLEIFAKSSRMRSGLRFSRNDGRRFV